MGVKKQIVYKKLDEIHPYKNNPRINDGAVEYVANSIKEFKFQNPIIIKEDGEIICGHTRYKASKQLGLKEVPCIVADDLTEEQIKAFRLVDNKVSEKSLWDYEKLDIELENIVDINMEQFDFNNNSIDWDNVEELSDETYDKPEHKMLECPQCHHIDRDIHFKKVQGVEITENKNTNE